MIQALPLVLVAKMMKTLRRSMTLRVPGQITEKTTRRSIRLKNAPIQEKLNTLASNNIMPWNYWKSTKFEKTSP